MMRGRGKSDSAIVYSVEAREQGGAIRRGIWLSQSYDTLRFDFIRDIAPVVGMVSGQDVD
jgi:hypothetical protein